MPKLSDIDIVCLAIGRWPSRQTRIKINLIEQAKLSEDKTIPERARKIVLREVVRLTQGGNVDDEMRLLIGCWASQQLNGGKPGRRKNITKEAAIYLAFEMITRRIRELNPKPQRKAIIAYLAEKFGVKQRRIYEAIKRQAPSSRKHETPLSAEQIREQMETLRKRFDELRR